MNERIQELAEQAFQPINDISTEGVADRYTFEQSWFQQYNQKFAELIVRECADIATNRYQRLMDGGKAIKEHFGVEE